MAHLVVKKAAKLLNVKVSTALDIIECILLVYYGFKPAYLGEVAMSSKQASSLWVMISLVLKLDLDSLTIVLLGDDEMFVSLDNSLLLAQRSILIDLDQTPPCLTLIDTHNDILFSVIDSLKCIDCIFDVEVARIAINSELYRSFGGPCIAGLLLGYPVVYKACPQFEDSTTLFPSYSEASSKLSFTSLTKIEISAKMSIPSIPDSNPHRRNIMEFTYPSRFDSELESVITAFWESYQSSVSSRSLAEDVIRVDSLQLVKSLVETGGISL